MISEEKYLKWIQDDFETDLNLMAVGYNPVEKKRIVRQGGFDDENPITDIKSFSTILSKVAEKHIGKKFKVRLKNINYSFLPDFLLENDDALSIKNFLNNIPWNQRKYFGEFNIDNLQGFLQVFTNYPLNYGYQDIILFSLEKDFVIQISHHGDFWLTSSSKDLLEMIGKELENEGATVIYGDGWQKV
jgi:hypothetical protein